MDIQASNNPVSKLSVLIRGVDLPVINFIDLFNKEPFIARDSKRKIVLNYHKDSASYCCFEFSINGSINSTIKEFLDQMGSSMVEVTSMDNVRRICIHLPIHLSGPYEEILSTDLFKAMHELNVFLWLDVYFSAGDIVAPPFAVTHGKPANIQWSGGLMDDVSVSIVNDNGEQSGDICLSSLFSESSIQVPLNIKIDKFSISHIHLYLNSLRKNRSIELTPTAFGVLTSIGVPLHIFVTHGDWQDEVRISRDS